MSSEAQKLRTCFVIPSLAPGGTERQLLYLLAGLRETHACHVICTREEGAWAGAARNAGATVHTLNTIGGWDLRIGPRVARLFRTVAPQVVQTFLFGLELAVNRAARRAGVPVLISSRRELAAWMKPRHIRAQRKANDLVDCIVANSKAVAQFAAQQEGRDSNAIRVIYNGIDIEAIQSPSTGATLRERFGIAPQKKIVGMVANFSSVKDHPLFLAMASLLIAQRDDVHFLLLGSGPNRKTSEAIIRAKRMQSHFTIAATVDDAASFAAAMDVCVQTSLREGFPNAVMEAMALARPVVAANVGGVPELVEDGVHGLLVSSRKPEDFAAAVTRYLDDPTFAARLGSSARDRIHSEYTLYHMINSYRALYGELLRRSDTRH